MCDLHFLSRMLFFRVIPTDSTSAELSVHVLFCGRGCHYLRKKKKKSRLLAYRFNFYKKKTRKVSLIDLYLLWWSNVVLSVDVNPVGLEEKKKRRKDQEINLQANKTRAWMHQNDLQSHKYMNMFTGKIKNIPVHKAHEEDKSESGNCSEKSTDWIRTIALVDGGMRIICIIFSFVWTLSYNQCCSFIYLFLIFDLFTFF